MIFDAPSHIYSTAINLNNDGVAFFSRGDFEEASHSFKGALEAMKSLIILDVGFNADQYAQYETNVEFQWSGNPPSHFSDEASFVYRRALIIVPSSGYPSHGCQEESRAIIFNTALSYHLLALQRNCSRIMARSLSLYQIADDFGKRKDEPKLEGEKLVEAVILNNVGQLCIECYNYDIARRCFNELSKRIISLNQSGYLEKCDCEGFLLNLLLEEPTLAAAA